MEYNCLSLNQIADSITEKISIDDISTLNYISTENMIVNKAGVEEASKLPNTKKVNFYRKKDILVSNIRPYFKKIWQADNDGGASADVLIYRANQNYIDEEYLYYFLSQDSFFDFMVQTSKGTKMPRGDKNAIANYEVSFPKNIVYQRKVASIGRTIDEKIKLNKKTIANLEELSQTLFKRWFVDFEFPDENGNPYKTSGGKFINSEVGQIPIGWEIRELNDLVKNKKDTFNPKSFSENQVVHFSLPAYDNGEIPILENVTDIKSNKWYIDDNCVLFSKMNPRTMRVWLTDVSSDFLNVCSTEFVVLKSDSKKQNAFIYNICKSSNFADYLQSNATGSTNSRQRIRPGVALEYKLAISDATMIHLGGLLEPYIDKISILRREIVSLIDLRDTLLPKLMSGEIELPDELEVDEHAELL